jgi:hypothetical protein
VKRFAIRSDQWGYTVVDTFSGLPAVIGTAPQDGLTLEEAETIAEILNRADSTAFNSQDP